MKFGVDVKIETYFKIVGTFCEIVYRDNFVHYNNILLQCLSCIYFFNLVIVGATISKIYKLGSLVPNKISCLVVLSTNKGLKAVWFYSLLSVNDSLFTNHGVKYTVYLFSINGNESGLYFYVTNFKIKYILYKTHSPVLDFP